VGSIAGLDDMKKRTILTYRDSNSYPSVFQPVVSRYTDYAIPVRPYSLCSLFNTLLSSVIGSVRSPLSEMHPFVEIQASKEGGGIPHNKGCFSSYHVQTGFGLPSQAHSSVEK
jgi:hypothetical protein